MLSSLVLEDVFVAHEAAPVVVLLNLLDVRVRQIGLDALVAEDEWTCCAAKHFSALATPSAIVLGTVFALSKLPRILKLNRKIKIL